MNTKDIKMKAETTLRYFTCEMRAATDENGIAYIEGDPVVFNQEAVIARGGQRWIEVIHPNALVSADTSDVVLTVEHDGRKIPLARTKKGRGTMQLSVVPSGLHMRAALDIERNAEARALYSAIDRGDMDSMSFLFVVAPEGDSWTVLEDGGMRRDILSISRILDVSVVTRPAYEGTGVALSRSEAEAFASAQERADVGRMMEVIRLKNRIISGL